MSFTQYCAGGLFRWVDHGFQTVASLVRKKGKAHKAIIDGDLNVRTAEALGLFSSIESLASDHEHVYNLTARRYPK